jgi:DNA-binding FadR family transcriptional regulator
MAKGKTQPAKLTDRGRQVVSLVVNSVAFKTHGNDAELDTLAKELGTSGPRLRPMLRRLAAQGWLTIEGKSAEFVYPTVQALRWASPMLTPREAAAIVKRLHS